MTYVMDILRIRTAIVLRRIDLYMCLLLVRHVLECVCFCQETKAVLVVDVVVAAFQKS